MSRACRLWRRGGEREREGLRQSDKPDSCESCRRRLLRDAERDRRASGDGLDLRPRGDRDRERPRLSSARTRDQAIARTTSSTRALTIQRPRRESDHFAPTYSQHASSPIESIKLLDGCFSIPSLHVGNKA